MFMEIILNHIVEVTISGLCLAMTSIGSAIYLYYKEKTDRFDKIESRINPLELGLKGLLYDRMITLYNQMLAKGYCRIHDKKNIEALYTAYHDLGGNGTITKLVNEMYDMPIAPPKESEDE